MTFQRFAELPRFLTLFLLSFALLSCTNAQSEGDEVDPDALVDGISPQFLQAQALSTFGVLPDLMQSTKYTVSEAKVTLGRQLYYETRLSKNQDLSCNSCHALGQFGVDRRTGVGRTSLGHRNQLGVRNSPSVYNAARQLAQFWDGRAADVEEQAKGPILNPVEMAMPSAQAVVAVLKSIPGYLPLFKAAFPSGSDPITYDNAAIAIGAFERKLVTKDRFDEYLAGDRAALTTKETHGLNVFMQAGCPTCHSGPGVGGNVYRVMGVLKAYATTDTGRYQVTKDPADRNVFKVPSLRNINMTAPYFHDGSQATLSAAIRTMVEYQTARQQITEPDLEAIVSFLSALTGDLPLEYIKEPAKLASGPTTPVPSPL